MFAALGPIALPPGETWWHLIAAPEEDGAWRFVSIDGEEVSRNGYSVGIRWGRITGYHNGCNACGFQDDRPAGSPDRQLVCTLAACAEQPADAGFNRLFHGTPSIQVNGDELAMRVPGHQAKLVRIR